MIPGVTDATRAAWRFASHIRELLPKSMNGGRRSRRRTRGVERHRPERVREGSQRPEPSWSEAPIPISRNRPSGARSTHQSEQPCRLATTGRCCVYLIASARFGYTRSHTGTFRPQRYGRKGGKTRPRSRWTPGPRDRGLSRPTRSFTTASLARSISSMFPAACRPPPRNRTASAALLPAGRSFTICRL